MTPHHLTRNALHLFVCDSNHAGLIRVWTHGVKHAHTPLSAVGSGRNQSLEFSAKESMATWLKLWCLVLNYEALLLHDSSYLFWRSSLHTMSPFHADKLATYIAQPITALSALRKVPDRAYRAGDRTSLPADKQLAVVPLGLQDCS